MYGTSLVFLLITLSAAALNPDLDRAWEMYKDTYEKIYNDEEDSMRRTVWETSLQTIEAHNRLADEGHFTYRLGINKFADIGQCGSCWAFSTTGSMEGQHFRKTGKLASLSESNLVDCSVKQGNQGCGGGIMDQAFTYIIQNNGIDTEWSYPYKPENHWFCHFIRLTVGATATGCLDLPVGSESALQIAVAREGPISVGMDAGHYTFQLYKSGVYNEPNCTSDRDGLDHGVLVVGYGVENGLDYWLVKNSWGVGWGDAGYIKMSRNKDNQCGLATMPSFPVV